MTDVVEEDGICSGIVATAQDGNGVPRVKTYLNAKERGLTPETMIFAKEGSTNAHLHNSVGSRR